MSVLERPGVRMLVVPVDGRQLWFVDRVDDLDPQVPALHRHRQARDVPG